MRKIIPILALTLGACATAPRSNFDAGAFLLKAPTKVALLPFASETTDMDGPAAIRKMVYKYLERWGYAPISLENTDAALRRVGITDGGQLRQADPAKLAEALGVDGLFYGNLTEFKDQNVGFYRKRAVALTMRFLKASSGEVLWEKAKRVKHSKVALNKKAARKNFLRGIGRRTFEKAILKNPLAEESRRVVSKIFSSLPRR